MENRGDTEQRQTSMAEAIGSGKKVRGRRHRNWRPDLIVLDDIENDENVNTPGAEA